MFVKRLQGIDRKEDVLLEGLKESRLVQSMNSDLPNLC